MITLRRRDTDDLVCSFSLTGRKDGESGTVIFVGTIPGGDLGTVWMLSRESNLRIQAPGCGDRAWLESPKTLYLPVAETASIHVRASAPPEAEAPDVDWGRLNATKGD
jgi:hypothetical protein